MASWVKLPDPNSAVGHRLDGSNVVFGWNGKLYIIAAWNSTRVTSFDPATMQYTTEEPLPFGLRGYTNGPPAVVGSTVYWLEPFNNFIARYNLDTHVLDEVFVAAGVNVSQVGGGIHYLPAHNVLLLPSIGHAYDLSTNTWRTDLTPNPQGKYQTTIEDPNTSLVYSRAADYGEHLTVFLVYDYAQDTWSALARDESDLLAGSASVRGHQIYFAGGADDGIGVGTTRIYDISTDSWSTGPAIQDPEAEEPYSFLGAFSKGDGFDTLYAYANIDGFNFGLYMLQLETPQPSAELEVEVDIPSAAPEAGTYLTVEVDIPADEQIVTAELLVTFNTRTPTIQNELLVTVDITAEQTAPTPPPAGEAPPGAQPLISPRALEAGELTQARSIPPDEYQFSWGAGGQTTGTATRYGLEANASPPPGLPLEGPPLVFSDWGSEPPTTSGTEWTARTQELLSSFKLPELMPEPFQFSFTSVGHCLKPITADLCAEMPTPPEREADEENHHALLPTRLELAYAAANEAGVALSITGGHSGLVGPNLPVPPDYTTEGNTPLSVISDLLLGAGALHWIAPGVLIVNGGGIPPGGAFQVSVPPPGLGGSINEEQGSEFNEEEPQLEDYLEDCRDGDSDPGDPCDGDTFETAFSGTLTWVERSGSGSDYTEVHNRLAKEAGRITREETTIHRQVMVHDPVRGSYGDVTVPVEWTVREHEYASCCPQALTRTTERTWTAERNRNPAATYDTPSGQVLTSMKTVRQRWHAEGWLRSRVEVTHTHSGWALGTVDGAPALTPTYTVADRSETYIPIGQGLWHINTRTADTTVMAVEEPGSTDGPVGSHWGDVVNSYVVVTDQAPPQVTCDTPESTSDCIAQRTAEYERDHALWEAKRDAWLVNHPDLSVMTIEYNGRLPLQAGDTFDGGIIRSISWNGSGVRTDNPNETTSIELVRAS